MITIKLPIQNEYNIDEYINQWNNVVRFAYNRFQKGNLNLNESEKQVKSIMNNIDLLDTSLIKSACIQAKELKNEKIIFGGKFNFFKRKYQKITKDEYKEKRNLPLLVQGSKCDHNGNRKFQLDIIDNNQIIFKSNRRIHINLQLPHLRKKMRNQLIKLQQTCEENKTCVTFQINKTHIFIIFDETILKENAIKSIPNRILSIDHNPNYVGLVICDYNKEEKTKIIRKEVISIKEINDSNQSKYQTNKRKYELMEISKKIIKLARHYQVEMVAIEDLNIRTDNKNKGKNYNKLVNNNWLRNAFFNNLNKRCNISGIRLQKIAPAYTTICGQFDYPDEFDMIASALEIGRRCNLYVRMYYKKEIEITKGIIIRHNSVIKALSTRWKEMISSKLGDNVTYVDLYKYLKETKLSYRFLFQPSLAESSFRLKSDKSLVICYQT